MRLLAVEDETYCVRTQRHVPRAEHGRKVCYRCGLIMGRGSAPKLGTLLDY